MISKGRPMSFVWQWPRMYPVRALAIALVGGVLSALSAARLRPNTSLQSLFRPGSSRGGA